MWRSMLSTLMVVVWCVLQAAGPTCASTINYMSAANALSTLNTTTTSSPTTVRIPTAFVSRQLTNGTTPATDVADKSTGATRPQVPVATTPFPTGVGNISTTNIASTTTTTRTTTTPLPTTTPSEGVTLTLSAPGTVVRQEEFRLVATVTNYGSETVTVTATLQKSDNFNVRTPDAKEPHSASVSLTVQVLSRRNATVSFWMVPHWLGPMTADVTAATSSMSTVSSVVIIVDPEGIPQQYSMSFVASPPFRDVFNNWLPPVSQLITGSVNITATAVGDMLGQSLDGLGNLLHMPYGCGEQNMMNFAPDVYILKYLRAVGKSTPYIEATALGYIKYGYERELTYQRSDGSFSAFGDWDQAGSVWLTAFVVKCFHEAREFISIDNSELVVALNWLMKNQDSNGVFREPPYGMVIHWDMQGGSAGREPLTAYVLISLLENAGNTQVNHTAYNATIARARTYLESQLNASRTNTYALNIICYALTLARSNSSITDTCYQFLNETAINEAGGLKHWQKANCVDCTPLSVDVEMTGYGLLTYTRQNRIIEANAISKWIIKERNPYGGFMSTQDTVVALQSLSEFAEKFSTSGVQSISISLVAASQSYSFAPITSANALTLQTMQLPSDVTAANLSTTGTGICIVQTIVRYNVRNVAATAHTRRKRQTGSSSGVIQVRTSQELTDDGRILMQACANYTNNVEPSGMCIMEIAMPTGYDAVDPQSMRGQANGNVKNVEVNEKTNTVVLYLDELNENDTCVVMTMTKVITVSNVQPAKVTAYLYYNPAVKTIHEYTSVTDIGKTWCDVCPECCACTGSDYFTCDGKCLSTTRKCNGVYDCLSGTDEVGCGSATSTLIHQCGFYLAIASVLLTLATCHQ